MASSSGLVVSLVLGIAYTVCAMLQPEDTGGRELEMVEHEVFLAADLQIKQPSLTARIRWPAPDLTTTSAVLVSSGLTQEVERTFRGTPKHSREAQQLLFNIHRLETSYPGEYTLSVTSSDGKLVNVSWARRAESEELTKLRAFFERAGHLRYVEALAYLEQGQELGKAANLPAAIRDLRAGIDVLGNLYLGATPVEDDTGMKLLLADSEEQQGKLSQAEALLERVLDSRTRVYASNLPVK